MSVSWNTCWERRCRLRLRGLQVTVLISSLHNVCCQGKSFYFIVFIMPKRQTGSPLINGRLFGHVVRSCNSPSRCQRSHHTIAYSIVVKFVTDLITAKGCTTDLLLPAVPNHTSERSISKSRRRAQRKDSRTRKILTWWSPLERRYKTNTAYTTSHGSDTRPI